MDAHFLDFCFLSLSHKGLNSLEQGKHWPPIGGRIDPPASGGLRPSGHLFAGRVFPSPIRGRVGRGSVERLKGGIEGKDFGLPQHPSRHKRLTCTARGAPLTPGLRPRHKASPSCRLIREKSLRACVLGLRHMALTGHQLAGLFDVFFSNGLRRQSSGGQVGDLSTDARQSAGGQLTDPQGRPQACPVGG